MLKDHKALIYGSGLFASAAILGGISPSEELVCVSPDLMCAPVHLQMADEQSGDGPQPRQQIRPTVTASSTVSTIQLSARTMIKVG
jgi:hypothetical protein